MTNDPNPTDQAGNEAPSPEHVPINERVLKLEIDLAAAAQKIATLEVPKPLWRDRRFLSGLVALPALIASGWVLTVVNNAVLQSRYLQPLPFIHTALGTEEAVKAYVAPEKTDRGEVVDEITSLFEGNFVSQDALEGMGLVSADDLTGRGYLNREDLRTAATEGEIDARIRYVGGRRQNFNDFFVQHLGLTPEGIVHADCGSVPEGAEILDLNDGDADACFIVGDAFRFSDKFTILRPNDVTKIVFELFVVSQRMTGMDGDGLTGEALVLREQIRHEFFELRVNAKLASITGEGLESNFAEGVFAYKYEAEFVLEEPMEDRTYDILTISLNLIEYDRLFGSQRRDKSFMVFVVPKFENS